MVPFAGEEKVVSELFPAVLAVLCLGKAAGAAAANWESGRGRATLLCVPFFPYSPSPLLLCKAEVNGCTQNHPWQKETNPLTYFFFFFAQR